jgi:hypothetical protein
LTSSINPLEENVSVVTLLKFYFIILPPPLPPPLQSFQQSLESSDVSDLGFEVTGSNLV